MMPLKTHLSNISHFSTSWQAASCRPELIGKDTLSWAGTLFPCGKHFGQAMLPVARVPVSTTENTMQPVKHWHGFLLLAMCHPCFDSWRAPINPTTKEEGVEGFFTARFAMGSYSLSWPLAPLHPCPHSSNSVPRRKYCLSVPAVPHIVVNPSGSANCLHILTLHRNLGVLCRLLDSTCVFQYGPACCHFPLFFFQMMSYASSCRARGQSAPWNLKGYHILMRCVWVSG